MKQNYYSLQQLAEISKIPASTVRYYRKQYKQFFPYTSLEGSKNPLFDSECIDVLKMIRKLLKQGNNRQQTIAELENKFSPIIDQTETPASTATQQVPQTNNNKQTIKNTQLLANSQQPSNIIELINNPLDFVKNQLQMTDYYKTQANQQFELIEKLQTENNRLQELIKALEEENKSLKPSKKWWNF